MDRKEEVLRKFGRYVTARREKKNQTIQELAMAAGLSSEQLRQIEAGEIDVPLPTIISLSGGLEISPAELLQSLDPD